MPLRFIGTIATVLTLSGCALPGKSIDYSVNLPVVVPEALTPALATHRADTRPVHELVWLEAVKESRHSFDFPSSTPLTVHFKWLASGALEKSLGVPGAKQLPENYRGTTETSLCGLVRLLYSTAGVSTTNTVVLVGAVPVPISSQSYSEVRWQIAEFKASTQNVCEPKAGTRFTYQATSEFQKKSESPGWLGTLRLNRLHTLEDSVTCVVDPEEKPASRILEALRGNYLEVKCSYVVPERSLQESTLAFLLDSGLYLPLSEREPEIKYLSHRWRYTDAKYRSSTNSDPAPR